MSRRAQSVGCVTISPCSKSRYESAKLKMKIKMIAVTTAPVVDLSDAGRAAARLQARCRSRSTTMMIAKTSDFRSPLQHVAERAASERAELMNDS